MSHVPPELRAITGHLRDKGRLKTQGLFVNSADAVMLWAMHQPPGKARARLQLHCYLVLTQLQPAQT